MTTMWQTACTIVNPIMDDRFNFLFNYTTLDGSTELINGPSAKFQRVIA